MDLAIITHLSFLFLFSFLNAFPQGNQAEQNDNAAKLLFFIQITSINY
ncbi:hypothetical protein CLOHYLEM_06101 [[Clostridium] hylemonae DSM 15053]|uniref:Uncharacterized protein n=1 Tax=[Clostridium] hylemonae DSM 15053 TaxID=553973 RepID=C0C1T2_9FIRM|nr:hypothetical protein CLOHYLEM_06101 [[Clostridium] hylemonae DSM 15053]